MNQDAIEHQMRSAFSPAPFPRQKILWQRHQAGSVAAGAEIFCLLRFTVPSAENIMSII